MTPRTRLLTLIAAIAILAIAAGFVAREPIERAMFVRRAHEALGVDVVAASADYDGGTWYVDGLSVGSLASPVRVAAAHAAIAFAGGTTQVVLEAPRFTTAPGADARDAAARLRDGLASFVRAYPRAEVRIVSGSADVGADVRFDAIDGTLTFGADRPSFDGTLVLHVATGVYPIAVRAERTPGGTGATFEVTAPALPVAALASFEPPDAIDKPVAGFLRDVDLHIGATLHGSAHLDGAGFALGTHALHGLHGELVFDAGGVGSNRILGTLDAVPFDAAGEVHDLPGPYGWMVDGSRDLRAFAKLVREIASEPQLRSVHFDTTAPGVGFAQYALTTERGPLAISVLTIDPSEPTLRIDTAIAGDHVISSGERTSAMGVRTGAVAGVNGDYFDIGRTYQPQGMLVRSGELVRGPVDRAALVIDKAKRVRFDEFHIAGRLRAAGRVFPVTQLNDWPAGLVTVITPAFGTTLPPAAGVTFAALEPANRANRYRVAAVTAATSAQPVSFGIAIGAKAGVTLVPGELVDLTYRLEPNVADAVAAIGGGPILVRDGAWYEDPHAPAPDERNYRWPVIALARQADDRLLLVAADGRHPERSIGMTRPEFGELLMRLGAVDAMALDSGGSVTMVSRAPGDATVTVRNVPSDNSAERWVSDALFIYSSAAPPTIVVPATLATPVPEARPTP
jgi:exopolysaccharide biosynthesis protein